MANPNLRLAENVAGDFFVDRTCIDCDACRQIAPATFRDHGDASSVYRQPESEAEIKSALMAIAACPTGSIGTARGGKYDLKTGVEAFPFPVAENIYYCGFNSENSFGAWSYLIVRPETGGGNVLVDSPRFAAPLVKKIEKLGGIKQMFLTHRDDIADHARFAEKFQAERTMHAGDGARRLGIENVVEGVDAVKLDDELTIVPVPGHTRGSAVLLYKNKFLFTGDHLAWSPEQKTLVAFRNACWYSWTEQTRSMEKLLAYDFEWVLPGHGRIHRAPPAEMKRHLEDCVRRMKTMD